MSNFTPMPSRYHVTLISLILGLSLSIFTNGQSVQPVFGGDHIPEMRLTIRQSNWSQVLDSMKLYGEGMIIGTAEIDGIKYPNVGIRYRGQTSYVYEGEKNPYQIELNYIHPDQHHQGHKSFTLSNALRDPSYLREYLGFSIARKYMPAPEANFIRLFVNNDYAGIYINIEPVDANFLERRMSGSWTTLFKCSPDTDIDKAPENCKQNTFGSLEYEEDANCYLYNYRLKEGDGWQDLIELCRILDQDPGSIESVLDVDATLWMHAFNNLTANLSSYSGQHSHNYYLLRDIHGRFSPVIWDLNLAFGSFKNTGQGSDLSISEMIELDPFLHEENVTKPLIRQLLANEFYRKIYVSHMRQLMQEQFRKDSFRKQCQEVMNRIKPAVSQEKNGYYSLEDFTESLDRTVGTRSKIPGLAQFMEDRVNFLKRQDAFTVVEPEVLSVEVLKRKAKESAQVNSFTISVIAGKLPKRVHLYYRFAEDQPFTSVLMEPKPDDKLGNGEARFVSKIKPANGDQRLQYYILAENTAAVTFYPNTYRQAPLSITLEELN